MNLTFSHEVAITGKRDVLIDMAKGVGILLVVFAHTYKGDLTTIIYYFHMPLFFMLTGCALNYSKQNGVKWKRLLNTLLIPYISFSLLTYAYWSLIEIKFRPVNISENIPEIYRFISYKAQMFINIFVAIDYPGAFAYDIVLWFFPCLIMCRILYGYITKSKYPFIFVIFLAIIGILMSNMFNFTCPWCLELSFASLLFVCLGHKYYLFCRRELKGTMNFVYIFMGGGILLWMYTKTDTCINMLDHEFAHGLIYFTAIVGSVMILCLCNLIMITSINKTISFLGRNSLIIMCLHEPIKRVVIKGMSIAMDSSTELLRQNFLYSIIAVIVIVIILLPCIYTINRWIPWMAGKKHKNCDSFGNSAKLPQK